MTESTVRLSPRCSSSRPKRKYLLASPCGSDSRLPKHIPSSATPVIPLGSSDYRPQEKPPHITEEKSLHHHRRRRRRTGLDRGSTAAAASTANAARGSDVRRQKAIYPRPKEPGPDITQAQHSEPRKGRERHICAAAGCDGRRTWHIEICRR